MKSLFFDEDMDWDGPPWLTFYRWKCWIIGHRPEPVTLVHPKTGREESQVWCWRCGKRFEIETEPVWRLAPVASLVASTREPLGLPRAQEQKCLAKHRDPQEPLNAFLCQKPKNHYGQHQCETFTWTTALGKELDRDD